MFGSEIVHNTTVIEARSVIRAFSTPHGVVPVLRGITLDLQPGEFVALRGRSGSGKTTLLNVLVGLDNPSRGSVRLLGYELATMNENARAMLRRTSIGLLFQNAHLVPTLTALENVELALRLLRVSGKERTRRAIEALERVYLKDRSHHRGLELSGGEQQRVALARALVHQPRLVIADEPTGNLDSSTGQKMTALLREIVQQSGASLLVATHDFAVVNTADRVLYINDGNIESDEKGFYGKA